MVWSIRLATWGLGATLTGCVATSVREEPRTEAAPVQVRAAEAPAAPSKGAPGATPALMAGRVWLGIEMGKTPVGQSGVPVKRVMRSSPAAAAGMEPGDVIRSLGGTEVGHASEVSKALQGHRPGEVIDVVVVRQGAERQVKAKLEVFPGAEEVLRGDHVGVAAPALSGLVAVQGAAPASLEALRGKVVVVDFWASWCTVCKKAGEVLNGWHERMGAQGLVVQGVSSDEFAIASRATGEFGLRYPVAIDKEEKVFPAYGAAALPTLYVIDKKGVVRGIEVGFSLEGMERMERLVVELLAEK